MDRLLLQPGTLPETLRLTINGRAYRWCLGDGARYTWDAYSANLPWKLTDKRDPSARHTVYRSLNSLLRPLPRVQQRQVLDALSDWAGARPAGRATHRSLSPDELLRLAQTKLVDVGAHTMTHPDFSFLKLADQRAEIQQGKACLEQIIGRPVNSFAYPYGIYARRTIFAVRQAGFACACSSYADAIWRSADPFQLPRLAVEDCDGDMFGELIHSFAS